MPDNKIKVQVYISLSENDKERLQQIADDECRSFANLVSVIVRDYLKNRPDAE